MSSIEDDTSVKKFFLVEKSYTSYTNEVNLLIIRMSVSVG